jgi:iron complex transport system permease protein
VFGITVLSASAALVSVSAFAGALAMTIAVYLLAYRQGVSSYRFVLVGIGLAAIGTALVNWLLTRADIFSAAAATVWLTGSLSAIGWEAVIPTAVAFAGLTAVALVLMRRLRALQLGDDTAKGLGVEVEPSRLALLLVGVAAAGAAAAAAGPIMFVAFMAPPIARRLTGAPLALVPAALAGALLVVASDLVARTLFPSTEIPVGVVTGIVGAPYLLWLLARANRIGRGG